MQKLFYLIPIIVFIACNSSNTQWGQEDFQLTPAQALEVALSGKDVVSPETWEELKKDSRYRIVDIRSTSAFQKGHLDEAENIPVQYLLDKENLEYLREDGVTYVLIGKDQLEANGPWFLLRQMGLENVSVFQGGYEYLAAVRSGDTTATYLPEKPVTDFAAAFANAVERNKKEEEATKPKVQARPKPAPKKVVPVEKPPKKPVVVEEEGC